MRQSKRDLFQKSIGGAALAASALTLRGASAVRAQTAPDSASGSPGAVYAMTNELISNRVVVYDRAANGTLRESGSFATGGMGSGTFENSANGLILTGQSPDNIGGGNQYLFATNAGSNDISVFRVRPDGLELVDKESSNGPRPFSVTFRHKLLYVLNAGGTSGMGGPPPNISGFTVGSQGELTPIPNSTRPIIGGSTSGVAQVGFNVKGDVLVVSERAADILDTYTVDKNGVPSAPIFNNTNGSGPFGFTFTQRDQLLTCENFGGAQGQGAASSYDVPSSGVLVPISGPVRNNRSDTCWIVNTDDSKYAYLTNFQSGDISSYRVESNGTLVLLNPIAAVIGLGAADQALSNNSRYLYARNNLQGTISVFGVESDGSLTRIQDVAGLPPSAIGIAAR